MFKLCKCRAAALDGVGFHFIKADLGFDGFVMLPGTSHIIIIYSYYCLWEHRQYTYEKLI